MSISKLILKNLQYNEEFSRKVIPFLKPEYFNESSEKILFSEIVNFISKYSKQPTFESIVIQLEEKSLVENEYNSSLELLSELKASNEQESQVTNEWLIEKTESFCQEKAIYNAVLESITILDDKHKELSKGSIPKLLSDALAVSFDSSIGHNYFDDSMSRFDYYHREEERIPFALSYFNKITNGGLPKKTLNIILAQPHGGKSLMMCDFAANFYLGGNNVLYITCEMAEEEIAKRIDANLLKVPMDELLKLDKPSFEKKIKYIKSKTPSRLFIKEYPTAAANVNHFRTLLNELRLKNNFVPDIVFVDYLNICASARVKMSGSVNSYTYVKAIGEELRGFAQEFNIPVVSATQTTRGGANNSDVEMTDVSESFGINAIADFLVAIINSEELQNLNQIMVKQLKNRYRDLSLDKRFVVGVDRKFMKLYDVENSAQQDIIDSGTTTQQEIYTKAFSNKKSFEGFTI